MAAAAGVLGVTDPDCLPRPLQPLSVAHQAEIAAVISALELSLYILADVASRKAVRP